MMFKISVGRDPKNPATSSTVKTQLSMPQWQRTHLSASMAETHLSACMVQCQPSTNVVSSWCPRGVMVKAMNCGIVVREFVLQSRYYVHFRANTLGKGMNPLILPPAMGK